MMPIEIIKNNNKALNNKLVGKDWELELFKKYHTLYVEILTGFMI
ncbi:hypothetical protein PBN151_2807 [Paenibacillus sp. NAIST15-1]|nr:hypothetical protein PBN151_2807 [Paenibacillus sp. NAIST15-1]